MRHVARRFELRGGAGEVEAQGAVDNLERELHLGRHLGRVAREIVDGLVAARGQAADRGDEAPLGEVEVVGEGLLGGLGAVALEECGHAGKARHVGGDLGPQIAQPLLRRARVQQDDVDDIAADLARAHDPHRRQPKPLLEDGLAGRRLAARHHAADVRVVGDAGDEGGDAPLAEHRGDDVEVGQVGAAAVIGVVGDEHVAFGQVLAAEAAQDEVDGADHRAEVDRHVVRLRDHLAARVEDRGRAVLALLDVGRVGGADQHRAHLLGGRERVAGHHLGGYRVNASAHSDTSSRPTAGATSMARLP